MLVEKELIEHHPEAVDISFRAGRCQPLRYLFRSHVSRTAADIAGYGKISNLNARARLGEPEVEDIGLAVGSSQDVRGFEIAVNHASVMGVLHSAADLPEQRQDSPLIQTLVSPRSDQGAHHRCTP